MLHEWRARGWGRDAAAELAGFLEGSGDAARANEYARATPVANSFEKMTEKGKCSMAKTYKIAVMPGDGTGPEVIAEAVKVLKAAADKFGFKTDLTTFDFGGERYKRTGETLPDSAVEELAQVRRHSARRDRPSGRQAGHPGERASC